MSLLRVERRERVALLVLDDPERRNALTVPLVSEIVAAVDALEGDDGVGALVVSGAPPAFCAGADLGDLAASGGSSGEREAGLRSIYEGFLRLARSTLPTVAAVNGPAVGAGMNLALGCDVRVAGASARFDSRFLHLGLHPGGGHTWLLHRLVGPQSAAALALFGERVDGTRAAEIGLAWACVPDAELVDAAVALAARAADAPRELAQRLKASLRAAPGIATHDDAVTAELVPQLWSVQQPEFRERLGALARRITSRD
jgi:enoyl-CoA hydratase